MNDVIRDIVLLICGIVLGALLSGEVFYFKGLEKGRDDITLNRISYNVVTNQTSNIKVTYFIPNK